MGVCQVGMLLDSTNKSVQSGRYYVTKADEFESEPNSVLLRFSSFPFSFLFPFSSPCFWGPGYAMGRKRRGKRKGEEGEGEDRRVFVPPNSRSIYRLPSWLWAQFISFFHLFRFHPSFPFRERCGKLIRLKSWKKILVTNISNNRTRWGKVRILALSHCLPVSGPLIPSLSLEPSPSLPILPSPLPFFLFFQLLRKLRNLRNLHNLHNPPLHFIKSNSLSRILQRPKPLLALDELHLLLFQLDHVRQSRAFVQFFEQYGDSGLGTLGFALDLFFLLGY